LGCCAETGGISVNLAVEFAISVGAKYFTLDEPVNNHLTCSWDTLCKYMNVKELKDGV